MKKIKVAIAGVGNCASSFVQGVEYYRGRHAKEHAGLMHASIGGWRPCDIEVVVAFDIDHRKVGHALEDAVFATPNCTRIFQPVLPASGVVVQMGPVLDGVADHMEGYGDDEAFRVSEAHPVDVTEALQATDAEVLICYLPVGSEQAVRYYAQACLDAGMAMINCVPVFLASDPAWAEKFRAAGSPIVGDDIKSQVGATIVHRSLGRLFADRGVKLDRTYQLNTGGNTDFLNMLQRSRLQSKKRSKTESVQSQLDERLDTKNIHIGPSDYVPWQDDNKIAFIRMEGRGFGDVPMELELRLSVQDSPNSAGVVIDAVRCAKLGLERGLAGPLEGPSAYYMKSPPRQMRDEKARCEVEAFIVGGATAAKAHAPVDMVSARGAVVALERRRTWTDVLVGAHRGVLASLEAHTGSRPTGRRNAKGDAVYAADLAAEHAVIVALQRFSEPLHLVSEESGELQPAENGARHCVVIDPVDGSDNQARELPLSALSVAVLPVDAPLHPDEVEAAVVGPLDGGEPWLVVRGEGARRGLQPLATSGVTRIEDALLSVELNHHDSCPALADVLSRARGVRSYGCASRALALVAGGHLDAHIDIRGRLTPESYLAGAALVTAAGGSVVGTDGKALPATRALTDRVDLIAAAAPALAAALVEALGR